MSALVTVVGVEAWDEVACLGELGRPAHSGQGQPLHTTNQQGAGALSKKGKLCDKRSGLAKRLEPHFSIPVCLPPSPTLKLKEQRCRPGLGAPSSSSTAQNWR